MVILDTNVVSEAMKVEPLPTVQGWLDEQAAETLYLSSVTLAEILFGIGIMPDGRRKQMQADTLDGLLDLFGSRVVAFIATRRAIIQPWQ
jgi:toxin FitB